VRSAVPVRIRVLQATLSVPTAFRARSKFLTRHFCAAFTYQVGAIGELARDLFDDPFELGAVSCSLSRSARFHNVLSFWRSRELCCHSPPSASFLIQLFRAAQGPLRFPDILFHCASYLQTAVASEAAGFLFDLAFDLAGGAFHSILCGFSHNTSKVFLSKRT
jgi:hypothetical protein